MEDDIKMQKGQLDERYDAKLLIRVLTFPGDALVWFLRMFDAIFEHLRSFWQHRNDHIARI